MNSLFTLGLMIGIQVSDMTVGTTIANLGMTDVKFPKSAYEGDTVHCTTQVVSKRELTDAQAPALWNFITKPSNRTARWSPSVTGRPSCGCGPKVKRPGSHCQALDFSRATFRCHDRNTRTAPNMPR